MRNLLAPLPLFVLCLFLCLSLGGCGEPDSLLEEGNLEDEVYGEGGSSGGFGVTSKDPGDVGTIRGVVRFSGRPYKRAPIQMATDQFCVNANPSGLLSENFVFDKETGGLANVMIYIQLGMNMKFDPPSEPLILDQIGCRYVPHMALLQVGQPLVVKSQDNTLHNVHGVSKNNGEFNKTMSAPGVLPPIYYDKPESGAPALIKCDVHGWMKSYLAVLRHPFCAITDEKGNFEIKGVPPGNYQIMVWHEFLGDKPMPVTLTKNQTLELEPIVFSR